jgi:hypothetical protein
MSEERIVHALVALAFCGAFLYARRAKIGWSDYPPLIVAALLGSWVPDWDLVFGIGFHRSPLTHSCLPALLVLWLSIRLRTPSMLVGFALGTASHLLWDIVFYGDVRLIEGGNSDRLYLLVNAGLLLVMAFVVGRRIQSRRA